MDKNTVIAVRKKLKQGKNLPLKCIIDENYYVDERTSVVVWDDANGLLYAFHPNQEREDNTIRPGCVHVTGYDNICNIYAYYKHDDMKTLLDQMTNITENAKDNVLKQIFDLSNLDMYTDAKTTEKSNAYYDRVKLDPGREEYKEDKDTE